MASKRELDENLPAVKVIRKWGTNARFANAIGRSPSTTDRYLSAGYFVGNDVGKLIEDIHAAAQRDDIILRPTDFVDLRHFPEPGAPQLEAHGAR